MTPFERADMAKHLLQNQVFKEALEDTRSKLISQLEDLPFGDVETQHEVALMLQLLKRLKSQLNQYIQDQTVLEHRQKQDSFMERAKQRLRKI